MSKLLREILDMSECPKNTPVTIYDSDGVRLDNCSDYEDPCQNCCHRCHKEIEIPDNKEEKE